jgi:hypothetical protein
MSELLMLIKALPEVFALLRAVKKAIEESERESKVKHDVKAITEAFNAKDPTKLDHIFNPPASS